MSAFAQRNALYRTIWRWHFYAGLFVVPMILILSLTGAAYLFKPQVERWEERAWQNLPVAGAVSPDAQLRAALAAYPGATFLAYRLANERGDAAMISLALPAAGRLKREVFVSPQGHVLGALDPDARIMETVQNIHGQLLLGKPGSLVVELAASWAIVMIVTGLFLWWPRGRGGAGVLWPRLSSGTRTAWRDMHAVTGFWVSGLAFVLLVTGLPWAEAWGSMFKVIRTEMGWVKGEQDWTIGGQVPGADTHAGHAGMPETALDTIAAPDAVQVTLSRMVLVAREEQLAYPVLVTPPGSPGRFGRKGSADWSVRSDSQNRPLRVEIRYDAQTGTETSRKTFADDHLIDRAVGYGVAWHEGQLFGWVNQVIGVLTALMLVLLAVTGFVMWRRRKPGQGLGAPPYPGTDRRIEKVMPVILALAAVLPLLALSLVAVVLFDWFILPRWSRLAAWLGVPVTGPD